MRPSIATIILTYNEEVHITRAIASIAELSEQIFVVDSFSTDQTVTLAKEMGATVVRHAFVNQAAQFQWALESLPIKTQWILRIDADEIFGGDLRQEIKERLPRLGSEVVGIALNRRHIFWNRWIRHGGRYPLRMIRLFRFGFGAMEQRWMDEHIIVWGGQVVNFEGCFMDHNLLGLSYFIDKHKKYADRQAVEFLMRKWKLGAKSEASLENAYADVARRQWMKRNIFERLPLLVGPFLYFFYRYFIQMGFLDGQAGLVYHVLQGFWYRFLVAARILELEAGLGKLSTKADKIKFIENETRLRISDWC